MKTLKKMAAAATAFCLGIACLAPGSIISPDDALATDLTADRRNERYLCRRLCKNQV